VKTEATSNIEHRTLNFTMKNPFNRVGLVLIVVVWFACPASGQTTRRAREDPLSFRTNPRMMSAFGSAVGRASRSVVRVMAGEKELALGTVVSADGYILTKNSEIADESEVSVKLRDGRTLAAEVTGNDVRLDLVMLKVNAKDLTPVEWSSSGSARVGDLLASPGPGGQTLAVGVVSVATRRTKLSDLPPSTPPANSGFLGVLLEEAEGGARITQIVANGAAAKAGLEAGDVVTLISGTQIIDTETMINTIQKHKPGEVVSIHFKRDGEEMTLEVTLGKRDPEPPGRRDFQNRLGGELSNRRGGFPAVLQHDTTLKPTECGGPVVDLDGKVIGLNIARAGRVESYAIPAEEIAPVIDKLKTGAFTPVSTPATRPAKAATVPATRPAKPSADRAEPFSAPGK
jgi:serine protease Do